MTPKYYKYDLIFALLLCLLSGSAQTQTVWYHEMPDSTRTAIRLQAHLLIQFNELSDSELNALKQMALPLAFFAEDLESPERQRKLNRLTGQQTHIPVITNTEKEPIFQASKPLVLIKPQEFDRVRLDQQVNDSLFSHSLFSLNELLFVEPGNTANKAERLMALWSQSGKLPNFILPDYNNLTASAQWVQSLNATGQFVGMVSSNGKLLEKVSWKAYPNRQSNGYFCFPLMPGSLEPFIPHKAGYRFSPDIMYDSPANRGYLKEFKAVNLSPDFELTDHFVFDKKPLNLLRNNEQEIINNEVEFITDSKRGNCAWFPGRAYLDGGIQSKESLHPNFSITAWIKPTQLNANNSILGKGRDFVLKLHNGKLTYTMQGIKDYISTSSEVPTNEWTFISVVHSAYENQIRFYLNGELTDQVGLITPYTESDYTLLIGSNLWEEFFVGYMDEIKIWSRELNEDEIRLQYQQSVNLDEQRAGFWAWLVIPLLVLIPGLLAFRKRKPKPAPAVTKKEEKNNKPVLNHEQIYCLGGLKVINPEGVDVSQKFSPKIKQLFVLVLLNSVNGHRGISTSELSGILWPGMSTQKAKNTRGTNIQNLKAALASCPGINLVFKDRLWQIELSDSCYSEYCDILSKLSLVESQPDGPNAKKALPELLDILSRGTLLPDMSESWLDPYISKMSDRIIEMGLSLFESLDEKQDSSSLYALAEVVSLNDPLNEPALRKKLQLLTNQGKLSLAHSVYDHFIKVYQEMYQENYPVNFKSLTVENSNTE
ncbi:LamG-like jellyroll fold domain-containing protein [Sunxiuqinia rutila]|uniref:LamG-like jellyroll fold domain-containing protein n=1 Tax=Sunxiuqinia rutila TaxID=1397841 RepID=UPI003D36DF3E